jgi:hypothetical protein
MADFYPAGGDEEVERVATTVRLRKQTHEDIALIKEIWNELDRALKKDRREWRDSTVIVQIVEVGVEAIWQQYGGRPADKKARAEFVRRAIEAIRSK